MTIGELSKATDISEYTLRYYERKGLIRVSRDSGGRRCYAESDIDWILFPSFILNKKMNLLRYD